METVEKTAFKVDFIPPNVIGESPYTKVYKGIRQKDLKEVAIITFRHLPPNPLKGEITFQIPLKQSANYIKHPFILNFLGETTI